MEQTNTSSKDIVAYFDFDGTITTKDTLIPFLLFTVGLPKFILNLPRLFPVVLLYGLKIITNEQAKQRTLTILIKGYSQEFLENKARDFALHHIDKYVNPEIFQQVESHVERGHKVIIVSANLAIYLRHYVKRHNFFGLIATEIEFNQRKATGKLATPNCYGLQKVVRIEEYLDKNNLTFCYSYAYGNSRGDYEMLDFVNEGYFIENSGLLKWMSNESVL